MMITIFWAVANHWSVKWLVAIKVWLATKDDWLNFLLLLHFGGKGRYDFFKVYGMN